MTTLQDRMKQLAGRVGNSPTRLAEIAGVKPPSAHAWLSGETKTLRAEPARRMSEHFGVSFRWLTEGIGLPDDKNAPAMGIEVQERAPQLAYEHEALLRLYDSLSPRAKKTVRSLMDQLAQSAGEEEGKPQEPRVESQGKGPRAGKTLDVDKALSSIVAQNNNTDSSIK